MIINTVGDLIELLKQFDPNMSVLKSDLSGLGYSPITTTVPMVFVVKPNMHYGENYLNGDYEYLDADYGDNGFPAVVL